MTADTVAVWQDLYRERLTDAAGALAPLSAGEVVVAGGSNAEPEELVAELIRRARTGTPVSVVAWPGGFPTPLADPELAEVLELVLPVPNRHTQTALTSGQARNVPSHVHRTLERVEAGELNIDTVLVMVSPPDADGYCSLGTSVINLAPACRAARRIVAEVNPQMPRTAGDARLHVSRVSAFVEVDRPLREVATPEPGPEDRAIAEHIARLVPDGATVQCGIGALPDAVLRLLTDRRDLGIHSGIVGDWLVDLAESGALDPARPVVTGSVMGTRRLYEFVHENPRVDLRDGLYTHSWRRLASCPDLVAINSVLEIDLLGQASAEQLGDRVVAGVGGLNDFIRGAALSRGGRSILVIRSTAKGGAVSRIVPHLAEGTPVSVIRADVQWVVTEHGAADLDGLDDRQRAAALISIAHPDHREALAHHAGRSTQEDA